MTKSGADTELADSFEYLGVVLDNKNFCFDSYFVSVTGKVQERRFFQSKMCLLTSPPLWQLASTEVLLNLFLCPAAVALFGCLTRANENRPGSLG